MRCRISNIASGFTAILAVSTAGFASAQARRAATVATPTPIRAANIQAIPLWATGGNMTDVKVPKSEKVIALTFDDGPNGRYTEQVLKILKAHDAKATFFMLGQELKYCPSLGRAVRDAGHAVGNHSWSHPIRTRHAAEEVGRTDDLIRKTLGIETTLFRPPYGILKNGLAHEARARKEAVLLWSVDTNDWKRPGASKIAARVINGARPGAIVLMHDGGGNRSQTVAALTVILDNLGKKGYRFVTIPELLALRQETAPMANKLPAKSAMKSRPLTVAAPTRPTAH